MGVVAAEIYIQYEETKRKAEQLEELADEIDRLANTQIEEIKAEASANWTGDAGNEYYRKIQKLEYHMHKKSNDLRLAAVGLKAAAYRLYLAEMAAASLF